MWGRTALGAIALSLALMALVGIWRSPAAVPRLDGPGIFPSLRWTPANDLGVTLMLWVAVIVGAGGIAAGLQAVRAGWRPRIRLLLLGGAVASAVLTAAPPMGSTDPMDYAAYGRMAVLGLNPHVITPAQFRVTGDPVALLAPQEWENLPSVYGPLATGAQWTAAELGGDSAVWIVLWLKVWNCVAFLALALMLTRLAGSAPGRRLRVQFLWTLNPLMLWALIGAAHVDGLAAMFAVAALALLGTRPWRGGLAGLALGAAAAVKAPYLLVGTGMAWAVRRSRRTLIAVALAATAVLACGYALIGPTAAGPMLRRGRMPSWNTPWQLLVPLYNGHQPPEALVSWGSAILAVILTVVFLRGLPADKSGRAWLTPALAVGLAWLLTTPVYYPWYEALVFPLIALAPASRLDWLQLGRALVATGGCLPGVVFRLGDSWLRSAVTDGPLSYVIPGALLTFTLALVAAVIIRGRPYGGPGALAHVPLLHDKSPLVLGAPITSRLIHRMDRIDQPKGPADERLHRGNSGKAEPGAPVAGQGPSRKGPIRTGPARGRT